jgi:hypothetical protein
VQHVHATIHNWSILFLIEVRLFHSIVSRKSHNYYQGVPAMLMGLVAFFFLPNRPESTTFLNEHERIIALDRMNRGTSGDTGAKVDKGVY